MADKNIVEEYVVKLSADTEEFDKQIDDMPKQAKSAGSKIRKALDDAFNSGGKQAGEFGKSIRDVMNDVRESMDKVSDVNVGKNMSKTMNKELDKVKSGVSSVQESYQAMYDQMRASTKGASNVGKTLAGYASATAESFKEASRHAKDVVKSSERVQSSAAKESSVVRKEDRGTTDADSSDAADGAERLRRSFKDVLKDISNAIRQSVSLKNILQSIKLPTLTFPDLSRHVGYYSKEADKLRNKIAKLESEMKKLAETKVYSEDYLFLQKEIDKTNNKLADYQARLEKLRATGAGLSSSGKNAFKSIRYDIETANRELRELNAAMADLKAEGGMYTTGASTPKYAKMQSQLKELQAGLAEVENSGVTVARQIATNIGNSLKNGIGNGVKAGVQIARAGFTNLGKALQTIRKQFVAVNKQIPTMADRFEALKKSMRDLVLFGRMWMQFTIIMTVFNEAKANIDNLAKTFDSFNDALSRIINSVRTFGAQMAAAFEPLVTVAAPYVEALVDALTRGMDTISQFTARLTGNDLYTKASKGNYDYAASLEESEKKANDATEAVEEYQNTVLGFDQLNKLNGRNASVDIGLDDALSDPQLNKVETQATKLNSIADKIHDAFAAGDYKGAGKAVAEAVNEAFSWLKNVAGWEANCERITKALRGVIDFINGFAVAFNGYGAGNAIGDVVNSIIHSLNMLTDPENGIDFALIGQRVGEMIKGFVDEVDWYTLGETVIQSIQAMINYINGIITVPGFWTSIGTAIRDGLQGAIDAYKPEDVANLVVNLVNGIATMLSTAFGATGEDNLGVQIGSKLAETVNQIFAGLKPEQIAEGINAVVNTIISTFNTFISQVDWKQVVTTLGQTLSQLDWLSIIELVALLSIPKIPGIVSPLLGKAVTSIFSSLGSMLLRGITSLGGKLQLGTRIASLLFGGASGGGLLPKLGSLLGKVGTTIGGFLSGTLLPLISGAVTKIPTLIGGALKAVVGLIAAHPVIAAIVAALAIIIGLIVANWDTVKGWLIKAKDWIVEKVGQVVEFFQSVPGKVADVGKSIYDALSGWFSSIADFASGVVDDIVGFFKSIPDKIGGSVDKIGGWFSDRGEDIKNLFKSAPAPNNVTGTVNYSIGDIPKLATGGIVGDGQLFIANEGKPELVGTQDGKSVVMNNTQIVDAVSTGVRQAVTEAMLMMRDNNNGGNDGDIVIMVDSEELARASMKGQKKLDRRNNPTVSFA